MKLKDITKNLVICVFLFSGIGSGIFAQNNPPTINYEPTIPLDLMLYETYTGGIIYFASDLDEDQLTAELVSDVSHGSLTLYSSGIVMYTPDEGYYGVDQFEWRAFDEIDYSAPGFVYFDLFTTPYADNGADSNGDLDVEIYYPDAVANYTLDASDSYDLDGNIVSWKWEYADGTLIGNGEQFAHTFPLGETEIVLTVTDNDGHTSTDEMTMNVYYGLQFFQYPTSYAPDYQNIYNVYIVGATVDGFPITDGDEVGLFCDISDAGTGNIEDEICVGAAVWEWNMFDETGQIRIQGWADNTFFTERGIDGYISGRQIKIRVKSGDSLAEYVADATWINTEYGDGTWGSYGTVYTASKCTIQASSPNEQFSTSSLDFGTIQSGGQSTASFTINNISGGDIVVENMSFSGDAGFSFPTEEYEISVSLENMDVGAYYLDFLDVRNGGISCLVTNLLDETILDLSGSDYNLYKTVEIVTAEQNINLQFEVDEWYSESKWNLFFDSDDVSYYLYEGMGFNPIYESYNRYIGAGESQTFTVQFDAPEVESDYNGTLTLTGNFGSYDISLTGSVVEANDPPIAAAGEDISVEDTDGSGFVQVTLDGSASSDDEGNIVSFEWTWDGGSASGMTVSQEFPVGEHEVTLTVTDGIGQTATDDILVSVAAFRVSVNLTPGWNWVSCNLEMYNTDLVDIFDSLSGIIEHVQMVVSPEGKFFIPGSQDEISGWQLTDGYSIAVDASVALQFSGVRVDVSSTPIELVSGWNYISYLPTISMHPQDALASISAENLAIVKGYSGFYVPDFGISSMEEMHQGAGYKIGVWNDFSLIYPEGDTFAKRDVSIVEEATHFQINAQSVDYQPIVAHLENFSESQSIELGIFDDGNCVGSAVSYGKTALLSIWSETPLSQLSLRVWDYLSQTETELIFESVSDNGFYKEISLKYVPTQTALFPNFPNPFNPSTQITYELANGSEVSLKIFDIAGREIATIHDGFQKAGRYTAEWKGCSHFDKLVSSGIYFAVLDFGKQRLIQKMILIR